MLGLLLRLEKMSCGLVRFEGQGFCQSLLLSWCLTSTEAIRLIGDGEKGEGVWRWGEREYGGGGRGRLYTYRYSHLQNDSCIKMGSDESHFNVSVGCDGQRNHKAVSTNYNLSEEKGEPKRNRPEALPLTTEPNAFTSRPNRLICATDLTRPWPHEAESC